MTIWQRINIFLTQSFGRRNPNQLYAAPVTLKAEMAAIYLFELTDRLSNVETQQIIKTLHQNTVSVSFSVNNASSWLLQSHTVPRIQTTPLHKVLGKDVTHFLPTGYEQAFWRNIMTEWQMLLHNHPVNQQRRAEGKCVVNGIWLWQ